MISPHLIAIVDDDPSLLRALHRLVQSNGYAVESFTSARAFLDASRRSACLVLDVNLNGTGFELQERLAADRMKTPIILITADDADSTRRRLETSGASRTCGSPWTGRPCCGRSVARSSRTTDRSTTPRVPCSPEEPRRSADAARRSARPR